MRLLLSIPVTWDFPLHRKGISTVLSALTSSFNFRYLGFSFAPCACNVVAVSVKYSFNSRYLGFSVAPTDWKRQSQALSSALSIPVTWDFPLHQTPRFRRSISLMLS